MITMLNEEGLTFKEIEEKIFRMVCEWGQSFARDFLEKYDEFLMKNRDKEAYRNKGLRETTIKTVFGEVNYSRRVYETIRDDGLKEFVYLLDEQLHIPGVGLISQNLADQLVAGITEMSYRANCDGIIIGSGTMIKEPDYSGSAYDPDLLQARIDNGKSVAPWTVIVTTTGKNIPFGNPVFSQEEIPMLVATSEEGIKNLKQEITKEYYELPLVKTEEDKKKIKELIAENEGKIAVLVTGEGKNTDAAEMLKVLRAMGMEKVLVESPTYCHHMMREGLLDEIFINTSCIFVGGQATGIGTSSKSFPSTDHPHSEIVTMHMHSPHFIYTRYKMLYGIK